MKVAVGLLWCVLLFLASKMMVVDSVVGEEEGVVTGGQVQVEGRQEGEDGVVEGPRAEVVPSSDGNQPILGNKYDMALCSAKNQNWLNYLKRLTVCNYGCTNLVGTGSMLPYGGTCKELYSDGWFYCHCKFIVRGEEKIALYSETYKTIGYEIRELEKQAAAVEAKNNELKDEIAQLRRELEAREGKAPEREARESEARERQVGRREARERAREQEVTAAYQRGYDKGEAHKHAEWTKRMEEANSKALEELVKERQAKEHLEEELQRAMKENKAAAAAGETKAAEQAKIHIETIHGEMENLKTRLSAAERKASEASGQLISAQQTISELETTAEELRRESATDGAKYKALEERLKQMEAKFREQVAEALRIASKIEDDAPPNSPEE